MNELQNTLWNVLTELRKEILLAQEIRARYVNFKITFVSACVGLIFANIEKVNSNLLLIPAIAAIFFDLLINSYSISTKRIGFYCRHYLEPGLLPKHVLPANFRFWEAFVHQPALKQSFSFFGNLGLTAIIVFFAAGNALYTMGAAVGGNVAVALIVLFVVDVYAHFHPTRKIARLTRPEIDFQSKLNELSAKIDAAGKPGSSPP